MSADVTASLQGQDESQKLHPSVTRQWDVAVMVDLRTTSWEPSELVLFARRHNVQLLSYGVFMKSWGMKGRRV